MKPTRGRIVDYTLTEYDTATINLRRSDFAKYREKRAASHVVDRMPGEPGATGHMAHLGNEVHAGDMYPASCRPS